MTFNRASAQPLLSSSRHLLRQGVRRHPIDHGATARQRRSPLLDNRPFFIQTTSRSGSATCETASKAIDAVSPALPMSSGDGRSRLWKRCGSSALASGRMRIVGRPGAPASATYFWWPSFFMTAENSDQSR